MLLFNGTYSMATINCNGANWMAELNKEMSWLILLMLAACYASNVVVLVCSYICAIYLLMHDTDRQLAPYTLAIILHNMTCTIWTVQAMGLTHHSGSLCSFQRKWYQNDTVFFENCAVWPAQTFKLTHQSNRLCSFIKENGFQKYHRTCY